jgi:hypothetical protein
VALLDDAKNGSFITWTGRGMEFKLIDPEEVTFIMTASFAEVLNHRGSTHVIVLP